MEWSKLKNIIIIMLAAVNLFLLVLVVHRQWESRSSYESAREDALAVLWETSRIRLEREILPEELDLTPMSVTRDPELEETQAAALLAVSSPMEAIYGEWTERKSSDLDPMLDCISNRAYAALQAQRELPVYRYPGGYAHEHGELEQYRASRKADIACKEAIESAITEHYRDNCLGREAVSQVVEQFGYERVLHVLANTVRHKEWDGRISQGNKAWARTVPVFEDLDAWGNDRNKEFVVDRSHPGIIDLFVDMVRHEYLLTQPLTKDDIRAEAARILSAFQAARGPNSPSGTHFMVQEGRKGVYALITKDEDRAQSLRLRKPSVRKKLSETKAEPGHTDKKKVREQER